MFTLSVLESAFVHISFVNSLITEHCIKRCNGHDLHCESKHHEYHENTGKWQSLRLAIPSLDFIHFIAEKVYANFDKTKKDADEAVKGHYDEQSDIEEHLHIYDVAMFGW